MEKFIRESERNCVDSCNLCKVKQGVQIFDEDDVESYCTHKSFVTEKTPDGKIIALNCREREIREESKVPKWCPIKNFSCPLHSLD